jgi:parallel beta-helix repeat protein
MNVNLKVASNSEIAKLDPILPITSTTYTSPIEINNLPGSPHNWIWAKDQGICTGSGTNNDPYIIKNHFFNNNMLNGLSILNSRKHFRIENCLFNFSSTNAGIGLYNTTNGYITENTNLPQQESVFGSQIKLFNSSYNSIMNNIASYCAYGIYLDEDSNYNTISDNFASNNMVAGIFIRGGSRSTTFNKIEDNILHLNSYGIAMQYTADNNTIKGNYISNNTYGLAILEYPGINPTNNTIYANCFIDNVNQATDDGINNAWDFGGKGNYWDDYTGTDANSDGIGDIPYNITGTAESMDNFPLMKCPTSSTPGLIPGYELPILIIGMVISLLGIIYLNQKKNRFKF